MVVKIVENANTQITVDHIIVDSAVKAWWNSQTYCRVRSWKERSVKQMIKIGLALIGVAVVVGLYSCVVAGKNTDNAMHDYFEKYK